MRKLIPTHWHAFMDYILSIVLLSSPWLSTFHQVEAAKITSLCSGGLIALLSILTANEGGIVRLVPMRIHLIMDFLLGIFLILSPFLFGFSNDTYLFHIFIGFVVLGSALFTKVEPKKYNPPRPVTGPEEGGQ
ncbi:SPW repeat domain-containing protein [Sphingobacterium chuzhouense]|uniref:SPW repeat-containing integral membrane domain-containing protein n=1 Tax=Sphingobacterium chuzhouense TaxID=1742264 RepID=A0ABR7XSK5_9SPHI|nr:hypothetical protein [Sphingobacterium chuzhouense]MBD1422150.1 hypothetical protein [Sphingobacterium chuzhouense]